MNDTIAIRIVVWFALNPDIEMTIRELSRKFNKSESVMRVSVRLLACRKLVCIRNESEATANGPRNKLHISIGPELLKEVER